MIVILVQDAGTICTYHQYDVLSVIKITVLVIFTIVVMGTFS